MSLVGVRFWLADSSLEGFSYQTLKPTRSCLHSSTWSFTTPVRTCAANRLVGRQSSKKPIWVFRKRCKWHLKQLIESTSNDCWSRLFHLLISLSLKKLRLASNLLLCLTGLNLCPLGCFNVDSLNIDSRGIADQLLAILNTLMILAMVHLSSKLQSPKRSSLSQYGSLENTGIILVNRCCTLSINSY